MSTNWKGYLLASVKPDGTTIIEYFPAELILTESWNSTPNRREELKAFRDDNTRDLHRGTAKGKKSGFSFTTIDGITLEEKIKIQSFFNKCMENDEARLQRKVHLLFWNDETNTYQSGYFYLPDITYTIKEYDKNSIIYNEIMFEFEEY